MYHFAALFFKLKAKAFKTCKASADAYAQCCQGRSVSMVWACRKELNTMSACLGEQ
jgi:COX assembly protein 1